MKVRTFLMVVLFGLAAIAGWSLDTQKVVRLEQQWGPLMGERDSQVLLKKEKTLELKLAPADDQTSIEAGLVDINLSRLLTPHGIKGYAAKATHLLNGPAHGSNPELRLFALTLWGVAQTLEGNEDSNPAVKITDVNQGWDALNQAVDQFGAASWVPRFYRINVGQALPSFFQKDATVMADILALQTWDKANPGRMFEPVKALLALYQGNALKRAKNLDGAIEAWHRAVALDPKKLDAGKAASDLLDLYE